MAPFIFVACEKPTGALGYSQVIKSAADVEVMVFDSIINYTQALDSLLVGAYETQASLGGYTGNKLVGSMTDGHFGRNQASFVSQMSLSDIDADFGSNAIIDSVSLYLSYTGSYGDTAQQISLEVYELGAALRPNGVIKDADGVIADSAFYSNYVAVSGELLGTSQFIPRPNTPIRVENVHTDPALKIALDTAYFQRNFANVGDGNFPSFSTNEEFRKYFNGIQVKATNVSGAILYFNLNSVNTKLVMYFHNDEDSTAQSVTLNCRQTSSDLPIGFNIFENDYSGGYSVDFDINNIDVINGEALTYIQAMGGLVSVFEIPNIKYLADSAILINKAELVLAKERGTGLGSAPPPVMEIREYTDAGPTSLIADFTPGKRLSGNGSFRGSEVRDGEYVFNITRYIFQIVNGDVPQKLAIVPVAKSTAANRVILQGGAGNSPISLKIYYTKP